MRRARGSRSWRISFCPPRSKTIPMVQRKASQLGSCYDATSCILPYCCCTGPPGTSRFTCLASSHAQGLESVRLVPAVAPAIGCARRQYLPAVFPRTFAYIEWQTQQVPNPWPQCCFVWFEMRAKFKRNIYNATQLIQQTHEAPRTLYGP